MKSLLFVATLFFSAHVFADGLIGADIGYWSDESQQATDTKTTRQIIDLTGGYLWPERFTVFGRYAMQTGTKTGSPNANRNSWGPGVGYVSKQDIGGYILATYYFQSTYTQSSNTDTGWGYQVDLGLHIAIKSIFVIAGVGYEHFEYNKDSNGTLNPKLQHTQIEPRIGLMFEF